MVVNEEGDADGREGSCKVRQEESAVLPTSEPLLYPQYDSFTQTSKWSKSHQTCFNGAISLLHRFCHTFSTTHRRQQASTTGLEVVHVAVNFRRDRINTGLTRTKVVGNLL